MNAPTPKSPKNEAASAPASNFLRNIIDADLASGKLDQRRWAGTAGDAAHHASAPLDTARIRLRFPPEPNGYLHVGHAKSICLNFGLARDYGGQCHLRFDDTNPEKESQEYVDAIIEGVNWLGFRYEEQGEERGRTNLFYASDYFDFMYRAAECLIEAGHAYVDEQSADEIRTHRGDFNTPGTDSPFRNRTVADSLARFREMRAGKHAEGSMVLRAKIDMGSPNINMRDPAIYRIRFAHHHRSGDAWCVYPMYTYAHPIEDALEKITHSICTLEFEDQRPFYDWVLERLAEGGLLVHPLPHQYEFARLNLTYVVTSKRKLKQLVDESRVSGWDDPRMPTVLGLRRRGYTPESIQLFCERIGVSKSDSWIDYSTLEIALRDDLDPKAPRAIAILDPLKLVITNWPVGDIEECSAPIHPHHEEMGRRTFPFSHELWIEREDFMEVPSKGYFRLFPGNKVRLKYGYIVECTGCTKDADGKVIEVQATVLMDTKSGTPGADAVKVKGTITWLAAQTALPAEVRLYDRLFTDAQPDASGKDFLQALNPDSIKLITAYLEPGMVKVLPEERYQFERHGYFIADRVDSKPGTPVFNRIATLRDSWNK